MTREINCVVLDHSAFLREHQGITTLSICAHRSFTFRRSRSAQRISSEFEDALPALTHTPPSHSRTAKPQLRSPVLRHITRTHLIPKPSITSPDLPPPLPSHLPPQFPPEPPIPVLVHIQRTLRLTADILIGACCEIFKVGLLIDGVYEVRTCGGIRFCAKN